ncbi:MAG: hypothetical protein ACRELV_07385, partial [Longimicrobiales bacterium]
QDLWLSMRESPWDEHQLLLEHFRGSETGIYLFTEAAAKSGLSVELLDKWLSRLPPMSLYVPIREQRDGWDGSGDVLVVTALNTDDGPYYAYDSTGGLVPWTEESRSYGTAIAFTPSERPEIRDEDGLAFRWISSDGDTLVSSVDNIMKGLDPRFQVLTSSAGDTTYLDYFSIEFCDGGGNNELRIEARFYSADGVYEGYGEYYDGDVPEPLYTCDGDGSFPVEEWPHSPVITKVLPGGAEHAIGIQVWEDDCDCYGNDDDYFGGFSIDAGDRGSVRSTAVPAPPVGHKYATYLEFDWEPIPSSTLDRMRIEPSQVTVWVGGDSEQVWARFIDQYGYGLSGYSVESWWVSNSTYASVDEDPNNRADVSGESEGTTTVWASYGTLQDGATVNVELCDPDEEGCNH